MCENQWARGVCGLACSACPARKLLPLTTETVKWHLRGKDGAGKPFEMGAYPMAKDETVTFALFDFDKSSWRRDSQYVARKIRELGLPVALERSRSGRGAREQGGFGRDRGGGRTRHSRDRGVSRRGIRRFAARHAFSRDADFVAGEDHAIRRASPPSSRRETRSPHLRLSRRPCRRLPADVRETAGGVPGDRLCGDRSVGRRGGVAA